MEVQAKTDAFVLSGATLDEVTASLAAIHARTYGRGPEGGKSYLCDDLLVCVLRGGRLGVEDFMLSRGRDDFVREVRLAWQDEIAEEMMISVERITKLQVTDYHSQVLLKAGLVIEMFTLKPPSGPPPDESA
ncbi:MAG: Na-translocating system protein MpsC family protein [Solirubrobacterales bacterium]